MDMQVISAAEFDRESAALLELLGPQEPIDYETLVASRTARPDPSWAGRPEPVRLRADVILPLPESPIRTRIYGTMPGPRGRSCCGCTVARSAEEAWTTSTWPAPAWLAVAGSR